MKKKEPKDYWSPADVSRVLKITYANACDLLKHKMISAEKVNKRWRIPKGAIEVFVGKNTQAVKKLEAEYIALYWQGLDPEQLQKRVGADLKKRLIIADKYGFAEMAIYKSQLSQRST